MALFVRKRVPDQQWGQPAEFLSASQTPKRRPAGSLTATEAITHQPASPARRPGLSSDAGLVISDAGHSFRKESSLTSLPPPVSRQEPPVKTPWPSHRTHCQALLAGRWSCLSGADRAPGPTGRGRPGVHAVYGLLTSQGLAAQHPPGHNPYSPCAGDPDPVLNPGAALAHRAALFLSPIPGPTGSQGCGSQSPCGGSRPSG